MKKNIITQQSKTDWAKIDAMSEDEIDYSDIPEVTEEFFKQNNKKYQTKINDVLQAYKMAYEQVHHGK